MCCFFYVKSFSYSILIKEQICHMSQRNIFWGWCKQSAPASYCKHGNVSSEAKHSRSVFMSEFWFSLVKMLPLNHCTLYDVIWLSALLIIDLSAYFWAFAYEISWLDLLQPKCTVCIWGEFCPTLTDDRVISSESRIIKQCRNKEVH